MTLEFIYIPHAEAEAYRKAGWSVGPIRTATGELASHALHSVLAWREVGHVATD